MDIDYSLAVQTLADWCERSGGTAIEFVEGRRAAVFKSRSIHSLEEIRAVEKQLGFAFPTSHVNFITKLGACTLFSDTRFGGGPRFYSPDEVVAASDGAVCKDADGMEHRFCFVGEHRLMGDFMGFLMSRDGDENFDVFCHEYPFEEYVAVSDELGSWRTFENWVLRAVESCGDDTL